MPLNPSTGVGEHQHQLLQLQVWKLSKAITQQDSLGQACSGTRGHTELAKWAFSLLCWSKSVSRVQGRRKRQLWQEHTSHRHCQSQLHTSNPHRTQRGGLGAQEQKPGGNEALLVLLFMEQLVLIKKNYWRHPRTAGSGFKAENKLGSDAKSSLQQHHLFLGTAFISFHLS